MSTAVKVLVAGMAAAATLSFGAQAAQAQVPGVPVTLPVTVKIGVYLPTDSDQKNFSGDTHFDLGAAYEFGKTATAVPLVYGVYADYIFQSSKNFTVIDEADDEDFGESFSATGKSMGYDIGFQARYLLGAPGVGMVVKPYAGLGVGFYSSTNKVDYSNSDFDSSSHTASGLGGKVMLGAQFTGGYLAELQYSLFPGDNHFDGYGVNVGYRF